MPEGGNTVVFPSPGVLAGDLLIAALTVNGLATPSLPGWTPLASVNVGTNATLAVFATQALVDAPAVEVVSAAGSFVLGAWRNVDTAVAGQHRTTSGGNEVAAEGLLLPAGAALRDEVEGMLVLVGGINDCASRTPTVTSAEDMALRSTTAAAAAAGCGVTTTVLADERPRETSTGERKANLNIVTTSVGVLLYLQ
jgi:hypothetical protein